MRANIHVLLTMAQLYKERLADLPGEFTSHWRPVIEGVLGSHARLTYSLVHKGEEFDAAVAKAQEEKADRIIVWPMAYTPSGAAKALVNTSLPLIIVSTARDYTLPSGMDGGHILANQSMHGVIDLCNYLNRCGRVYHLVVGHPAQEEFTAQLKASVSGVVTTSAQPPKMSTLIEIDSERASRTNMAQAVNILKQGRIGSIGGPLDGMMDLSFDDENQRAALGFDIVPIDPKALVNLSCKPASQSRGTLDADLKRFHLNEDLSSAELDASCRMALAMEKLIEDNRLDAIAMNFMSVVKAAPETMPFLGASRLLSRGIGYAGEGDILAAALCAAMSQLSSGTTFTELYSPDYGRNELFLSHMGECNYNLANTKYPVELKPKPFNWGHCLRPAVPVFQMRPGKVTMVSISETPGANSFQLLSFRGEIVESPLQKNLTVPYTTIKTGGDIREFLEGYSCSGGTHHLVLSYGCGIRDVRTLADLCNIEFKLIE